MPADAAAVVVLRSSDSLLASATLRGWFTPRDPAAVKAMFAEIDSYLRDRVGVEVTGATSVTMYYAASPERVGVIIDGVEGEPKGTEHSRRGETVLRAVDGSGDILAAVHGSQLLFGNVEALEQMVDALDVKRWVALTLMIKELDVGGVAATAAGFEHRRFGSRCADRQVDLLGHEAVAPK